VRYVEYEASAAEPNIVIDGSPNSGTVLCLTHWPGIPSPPGLADDLSAQMAFRYLDSPMELHGDADAVTNNHFDQDGLVGVFALVEPDLARAHRDLLLDVAAAGDFGTYRDRRAARISASISAWGQLTAGDPFPVGLEHLARIVDDVDAYREFWMEDDERLSASEAALAAGRIRITDEPALDLAVVTVDDDVPATWGHRFTGQRFDGVHPMAIHNNTDMSALALVHGRTLSFVHRYETWVQYQTRSRPKRVALLPLAHRLTELDDVRWHAEAVGALTPRLWHDGSSSLDADRWLDLVREHLRTAPPAFDPAVGRQA
jgi:hypothetical protein